MERSSGILEDGRKPGVSTDFCQIILVERGYRAVMSIASLAGYPSSAHVAAAWLRIANAELYLEMAPRRIPSAVARAKEECTAAYQALEEALSMPGPPLPPGSP